MNMNLEWKHKEENGNENYLNIPVKIVKSVDKDYGYSGKLVCEKCESDVQQKYICKNCDDTYSIGELHKRKDKEKELIYEESIRKAFLKGKIDTTVRVVNEIPIVELIPHIEYIKDFYEVYNNDESILDVVGKIYNYLHKKSVGLVVTFGHHDKDRAGIILSGKNKLLVCEIRDYRLIREPKQLNLQANGSSIDEKLKAVSENNYPELYEEFLKKIEGKEEIEVEIKEREKIIVEVPSFLD